MEKLKPQSKIKEINESDLEIVTHSINKSIELNVMLKEKDSAHFEFLMAILIEAENVINTAKSNAIMDNYKILITQNLTPVLKRIKELAKESYKVMVSDVKNSKADINVDKEIKNIKDNLNKLEEKVEKVQKELDFI